MATGHQRIYSEIHTEAKRLRQTLIEKYKGDGDFRKTVAEAFEWQGQVGMREIEEESRLAREKVRTENGASVPLR